MLKTQVLLAVLLVNLLAKNSGAQSLEASIDFKMVQQIAKKLGEELWNVGDSITKRSEVQESFSQARIVNKSGTRLVDDIMRDIKTMLDIRINAVKRIVKVAEELPKVYENTTNYENYTFVNTRERDVFRKEFLRLKEIEDRRLEKLSQEEGYVKKRKPVHDDKICFKRDGPEDHIDDEPDYGCFAKFNETIDLKAKESSVFIPIDVYDQDGNLTRSIHRTKGIDKAFFNNYRIEPTIGWQYFCNSTGLFRHFPATDWKFQPVNTYDCRTRQWFSGAAASSKDVMILIERSGSMLGKRLTIAADVVRNILDTLTPNDFVNIIQFNDSAEYIHKCTSGLVQATATNIFELKHALHSIEPHGQTDLAEALWEAFDSLAKHKKTSANCNQVIMLITDGMEYNQTIQNIFREHNWNRGNNVRVFSFLIGDQIPISDYEQVKLMACFNRGFYTQIDTLSETKEQALKYISIMARPMALSQNLNTVHWSNLYVDIIDTTKTTNYEWNCIQSEVQRERVVRYLSEYDWYPCLTKNKPEELNPEYRKHVFMTTVSSAAYDRGVNASLMGVAAIDVPLFEFERLFQNFRLGVGGYAFVVDQNGNILSHPDFRPFFRGKILKPAYNAIDMAEIELMDDGYGAREFSSFLQEFRESIISKASGSKYMMTLQPFDDMRRAFRLKRNYFWRRINATPFTIVVTFPDHFIGRVQVPEAEIDSMMSKGSNLVKFFKEDFKLHPDWIYCRSIKKGFEEIKLGLIDPDNCEMTPEEELVFYLEKFETAGWKWKQDKLDSNETRCDRKLLQALLFDAKATEKFPPDYLKRPKEVNLVDKFHVLTSFISTHSGLLRYKIFDKKIQGDKFAHAMRKSIDEVWYRHAVDFNKDEPQSFVYSVPFNAYEQKNPRITATNTIFKRDGPDSVPVAVVGFQFAHSKLEEIMEENCPRDKEEQCYILDDNAYILSDPDAEHTGKFFGSIEKKLMHILIEDKVYESIRVYDYQAVCYQDRNVEYAEMMEIVSNSALTALLWNPLKSFLAVLSMLSSVALAFPSYMANLMYPDREHYFNDDLYTDSFCQNVHEEKFMSCLKENEVTSNDTLEKKYRNCLEQKVQRYQKCISDFGTKFILKRHLNRSRPIKCDKFNFVYSLTKDESNFLKPYDECSRPFVIQRIAHSNLILLMTNRNCAQVFATEREFYDVPQTIHYEDSIFCHKLRNPLFRGRPKSCMTHHDKEPKFDPSNGDRSYCGRGYRLKLHNLIATFAIISMLKILSST